MKALPIALMALLTVSHGALAQNAGPLKDGRYENVRVQPIRGRVVDGRNSVPLRRARIVVAVGERRIDSVFTDEEGRFALAGMPAVSLTVRVSKAGFAAAVITLGADEETDLRVVLMKSAAVSGRVVDAVGGPAPTAYVRARALLAANVATNTQTQFFIQADQLGDYRLGNLPAGRYELTAVRVRPERWAPDTTLEARVFGSPESLETSRATTLSLAPGEDARDVNFSIAAAIESCPTGPSVWPAPGAVTSRISGRVTAATGEPIPCAAVAVVPDSGVPTVYTDRQGRYVIDGLRAGSFAIEARKSPHGSIRYGQRRPSDAETFIVLKAGERRTGADLVLPGPAIVSGSVVDEFGEPIEGITVWPFQLRRDQGRMAALSSALPRATDDRGQYRLIGVEPGAYVIAASGRERVSAGDVERARGYAMTFHPGVTDVNGAQRVTLSAGADVSGIDIVLTPAPTATVSGSVLDNRGQPVSATVLLDVSARSGAVSVDARSVVADANGRFSIRNVPAGDYVLKASASDAAAAPFGMQYVTVDDRDPPPVQLTLSDGATLEGRVVIDSDAEPNIAGLGVTIVSVDYDYAPFKGLRQPTMWARQQDGSFRAAGVIGPSRLAITETPACAGCYLKSARLNGADVSDRPFDLGIQGGVFRDVEIVVSDAGAAIDSRATDDRGRNITSFSLVVFSTSRDLWYPRSRHLRLQRSFPDGIARITGLPPGGYYVVAVERDALPSTPIGVDLADPDMLEQLVRQAVQVTLGERDSRTVGLRLAGRRDSQP